MLSMLSRRFFVAGGLSAIVLASARPAHATLVRAITLTELVGLSQHAVVATPTSSSSRWETIGDRERIVTYTPVRVEYVLDGSSPPNEIMVRTLGGRVGDLGQLVPGEAPLRKDVTAALFLESVATDVFGVTAMAQGHYPIALDQNGTRRLRAHRVDFVKLTTDAAIVRLDGRTVSEVETLVYREVARGAR